MQQTEKNRNAFTNIANVEIAKITASAADNIEELNEIKTVKEILSKWYLKNRMTAASISKTWNIEPLKEYITLRINKETKKKIEEVQTMLLTISNATKIVSSISISIEWTKNRTWGNCPVSEIRVCFTDNTCSNYQSGRITGFGYDKESTAVAQALNQCNEILRLMYNKKEKNTEKDNRDIFGYGSGYGVKPYFEGGVGISCYPNIFESIGYNWQGISHGKTFDVYNVQMSNK